MEANLAARAASTKRLPGEQKPRPAGSDSPFGVNPDAHTSHLAGFASATSGYLFFFSWLPYFLVGGL